MKYKILIAAFILFCSFTGPGDPPEVGISFNSFWKSKSVAIAGYTKINARYEWVAGAFDSGLHVPQYNGVPSGLRLGVWTADGAVAVDTSNHRLYFYSGGSWRYSTSGTGGGTPTLQQVLTAGSTLTTNNTIDGGGYDLAIANANLISLRTQEVSGGEVNIGLSSSPILSGLSVGSSGIVLFPLSGNLKIDSLNYTLSTTGKKIMLRDTATGLVQNIDPALLGGGGTNIYNSNGTLTGNRILNGSNTFGVSFDSVTYFRAGLDNTGGGGYHFGGGNGNTFSGYASGGWGYGNTFSDYSGGWGQTNNFTGETSGGWGYGNVISGYASGGWGDGNTFTGYASGGWGGNNNFTGGYSGGWGTGLKVKSYASAVIGSYNDSTNAADPINYNSSNRVFQIGIGTADNARANAMTVLQGGNVGIGTSTPAKILHTVGTVRHETLGTASGDTTANKPVGINSSGDIIPMTYWPGGGGGGWGTTGTVATLTGASTLSMGTNNFTFASTGDANLMKIDAVNDRINISNSGIALGVLTVGGNTWINGSYLAVNDGSNQSTLGSTYLSLYNSFGTPEIRNASGHFQISPIAGYSTVINDNGVDADFRVEGDNDANLIFADAGNDKVGIGTASPNSKFEVNGSFATKYTATATGITLDGTHSVVNVTATGQTITLPTAASITGRQYTIKLTASGSATVATTSSQTIDGSTTYSLASQYKYVTVVSDGSNWIVTANN